MAQTRQSDTGRVQTTSTTLRLPHEAVLEFPAEFGLELHGGGVHYDTREHEVTRAHLEERLLWLAEHASGGLMRVEYREWSGGSNYTVTRGSVRRADLVLVPATKSRVTELCSPGAGTKNQAGRQITG